MEKSLLEPDRVESGPTRRFLVLATLALTWTLPGDGHGQANRERERVRQTHRDAPLWIACFAPNECEVRVFVSAFHGRKGRIQILSARSASACHAAGYSHHVVGTPARAEVGTGLGSAGHRLVQRVYFTHDSGPPARPCSFSATVEPEIQTGRSRR